MAYVKRGGCIVETEDGSVYFKQDELMIIASNVLHSFQAGATGCTLLQLEFPPNILNIISSMQQTQLNTNSIFSTGNTVIKIVNNMRIMRSVQRIITEMHSKNDYYKHLVIMYYAELFILIHRHLNESYLPMCNNPAITKAIKYIRLNYHKEMSTKSLSAHTKVGERYMRQLFSRYMNISPIDYLNQIRINKAVELLRISEMSIKEICYKCGFKSPQYFSRAFKLQLGVTPTEIRNCLDIKK